MASSALPRRLMRREMLETAPRAFAATAATGRSSRIRAFLLIWLPTLLVLSAIVWMLYFMQMRSTLALTEASERASLQIALRACRAEFANVRADLLFLSDEHTLVADGKEPIPSAYGPLAARFLAFATRKRLYDQVRFLDLHGREIVRVNWNDGHPASVAAGGLQDKSSRYYVRATLPLRRGAVYASPLDLNVEHNRIEHPLKPTMRFGTTAFDRNGEKRGAIVVNYLGAAFLDRLRRIRTTAADAGHIWLMNAAGYWMLSPRGEDEWGFMFPGRDRRRLAARDPHAWALLAKGAAEGQFSTDQGLYTYAWFDPLAAGQPPTEPASRWLLVSYKPAATLAAVSDGLRERLWLVLGVLALIFTPAAWAIASSGARRRQAEEGVRASEARFRALLESAPDAILIVDPAGRIVLANAQVDAYFGYAREELLGQSIDLLVPQSLRHRHEAHRAAYAANPYARPMGVGMELFGQRKDGSTFPLEVSLSPLQTPDGAMVTAIIRDISARKAIERQRQEAQARYQDLMNNLPVGVFRKLAGPERRFLEVNPALVNMLDADSAEALLAHPVAIFQTASGEPLFGDNHGRPDTIIDEEIEIRTLKGRPFCGAITARPTYDADGRLYFDGIIEDITRRKEIEQQLQRRSAELELINHELEAFSYSVSHDLRAPLRAIDGFSRILLDDYADRLDDVGRDRLGRVRRAAQHMGTLIDDLLKLSRVSRTELHREAVDLGALARDIMAELQRQSPERQADVSIADHLEAWGDRGLLRIVLDNLLGNAWKFTGRRDAARISLAAETRDGECVYVVEDNGAGFDMAYADKLFGVFQRLHDTGQFPGTGIGLATVQRIIHKHGGRIWAESEVDKGTRFYFTLEPETSS